VELWFAEEAPFVQFLGLSRDGPGPVTFAMLLGNPNVAGRRFVLLLFDAAGRPVRVVKAGTGFEAEELIRREARFLKSFPAGLLHAPSLHGEFAGDGTTALAMEFVPGPTPGANDASPLPGILGSWLSPTSKVSFDELTIARRLFSRLGNDGISPRVLDRLRATTFRPAIHHGDFAPWNIRLDPASKRWTVLDWERGDEAGPPAWDWFHYVIQPAALVRRDSPTTILRQVDRLLHSAAFRQYAAQAEIGMAADILLLAYLWHCRDVVQQSEGMKTIRELVEVMSRRISP
jgi:hypothetical protein